MSTDENIKTLNQIFQTIFQKPLPWNLKTFCEKFTFDIILNPMPCMIISDIPISKGTMAIPYTAQDATLKTILIFTSL